ncbi:O-methyltransferase MdmC [Gracilariopsis chorda]|uniref:O-methyltransferase MdmC n=1 Tax=Gracilariopsis chorda TaxID=448386 RepID=A0A2V3IJE3_9FLOR|nr:O-methyltransferase MdmC [Gracilariopsis chorda]|eukprot:PXF42168.1 O-methyltransferase MdmC [Gracilariopsis chorda]
MYIPAFQSNLPLYPSGRLATVFNSWVISLASRRTVTTLRVTPRASAPSPEPSNIDVYNQWLDRQRSRAERGSSSSRAADMILESPKDMPTPPPFPYPTLFNPGAEEYASDMTSAPTEDFRFIAEETYREGLFAPCMVGGVEGQFLKMLTALIGAKRVLDIGTFTGYSALSFAEGVGEGGEVITLEAEQRAATVARKVFTKAAVGNRVKLVVCDARVEVERMVKRGERFDIVFLDADKINYRQYYEAGLTMLNDRGLIMADNALCCLLYDEGDECRDSLHQFAQFVRNDPRVEQVMLTVREGILLARKV